MIRLGRLLLLLGSLLLAWETVEAAPFVYISNERSNDVTIIDAATDQVIATVPVGARPRGLRLSPDGKILYVALGQENKIALVDTASRKVASKIAAGTDRSEEHTSELQS